MSVKNSSRRRSVLLLRILVGFVVILLAFAFDNTVQDAFGVTVANRGAVAFSRGWEVTLATALSKYGDWPYLLGCGLASLAVLCVQRRYQASRIVVLILMAGLLAGLSCTVIRGTVCRTRPFSHHPQGFYGPRYESHWIVGKTEFGSFPSGHTATAMGVAAAIWGFSRRWAFAFGILGAAIAWSRICLGWHHFSDVVAATVWAFLVAPALVLVFDPWVSRRWRKWFGRWEKHPTKLGEPVVIAEKRETPR